MTDRSREIYMVMNNELENIESDLVLGEECIREGLASIMECMGEGSWLINVKARSYEKEVEV